MNKIRLESEADVMIAFFDFFCHMRLSRHTSAHADDKPRLIRPVFFEIAEEVKKHADVCQISNTICQPTKDRQKETMEQAKNAELVIVVGGKHSANTARLAELCRGLCKHVQHVETEDELDEKLVVDAKRIFITAGASTPRWVIDSVVFRVKTLRDRANRKIVYRYKPGEQK